MNIIGQIAIRALWAATGASLAVLVMHNRTKTEKLKKATEDSK